MAPLDKQWKQTTLALFAASMCYAVLRYHVFGEVPWRHLPVFTTNKAVSLTALVSLCAAYWTQAQGLRLRYGLTGFGLSMLHILMTLPIFTASAYPKLYEGARLSAGGELSVLAGCLAVMVLCFPAVASAPGVRERLGAEVWLRWQRLGYLGIVLAALHVIPIGFRAWLTPSSWPAGMPPITLWSCFFASVPLVLLGLRWLRRRFGRRLDVMT